MKKILQVIIVAAVFYWLVNYDLSISLLPHMKFFRMLLNTSFVFTGDGYLEKSGLFEITGACLGSKLTLCYYFVFMVQSKREGLFWSVINIFPAVVLAFVVTLIRISVSLPFVQASYFVLLHNIVSLALYFLSTMILYHFLGRFDDEKSFEC